MQEKPQQEAEGSKEKELLAPEEAPKSKKGRGLLHVPSRSSSQKIQASPTSTGLSGATAGDPRDSIGGQSKESKGSILGRHRNGTASSGDVTGPTNTPGNSQPSSPTTGAQKRKKASGILSLFGCCVVPQDANAVDGSDDIPTHKLDKIPNRPATASHRTATPSEQSKNQPYEKEPQPQMTSASSENAKANRASASGAQDEIAPAEKESETKPPAASSSSEPVVTVDVPPAGPPEEPMDTDDVTPANDVDADVEMPDADPQAAQKEVNGEPNISLPPPPPGPAPVNPQHENIVVEAPEAPKQKFLLPPIRPEHKGKKCLVLDLDETLVHSSFKILHQADFTIPVEIEGNYHNVYVIKRPGVDEFMRRVGELYEVVVFTASVSKYGDPLLDQLDIHGVVHHRLFRESCYNHQGNYVKDLSQVGRDLKDTIIIDNSPTSYIFHPQHAVPISSWFSDAHDNELLDLIPVLEDLAGPIVQDVSMVLDVTL